MQDNFDAFLSPLGDKLRSLTLDYLKPDWGDFAEVLDESDFDTSMRDKLESLTVVGASEGWGLLLEELDETPFDAALRNKLQYATIETGDAGWSLLVSQLGADFDRAMASKLGDAHIEGETEWPVMEDQLEAPTEAILAEKIRRYSVPYSTQAWRQFVPLLDKALPLPATSRTWRTLGLVAACIFLLGLGASLMWKSRSTAQNPNNIPASPQAPIAEPASPIPPAPLKQTSPSITETAEESIEENLLQTYSDFNMVMPQAIFIESELIINIEKELTNPEKDNHQNIEEYDHFGEITHTLGRYVNTLGNIRPVESPSLLLQQHIIPYQFPRPSKTMQFPGIRIGWSHAVFNTSTRLSDKGTPGYLSGIQVGIPLGKKLELITGIQYGTKDISREILNTYIPPQIIPNQRSGEPVFWQSLLEAEYTVFEIPIMLRYAVTDPAKRFSLAFQGGVSGIIIQEATYRHFDPQSPGNSQANNMLDLRELNPDIQTQRGGTYWGNFRFAPVVAYRFGNRFSLEAAPYIQLGQQRIGMRQLKLHSLGANASLMVRIGKSATN